MADEEEIKPFLDRESETSSKEKLLGKEDLELIEVEKSALRAEEFLSRRRKIPFTKDSTFSLRGLIDWPRMKLQTRVTETPPVLGTDEINIFGFKKTRKDLGLEYKPLSAKYPVASSLINPVNLLRLPANILFRTASFITPHDYGKKGASTLSRIGSAIGSMPLVKAISYRGRQVVGAQLTLLAQAGNVLIKPVALFHHQRRIWAIKKGMKANDVAYHNGKGTNSLCTQKELDEAIQRRNEVLKNWSIAVAVSGLAAAGTAITAGVGAIAAGMQTANAATHGAVSIVAEAGAAAKKTVAVVKEEAEHIHFRGYDEQKIKAEKATIIKDEKMEKNEKDKKLRRLDIMEAILNAEEELNKANTGEKMKHASAKQKKMLHLLSQVDPTFMSHDTKLKMGITKESEEDMMKRVERELVEINKKSEELTKYIQERDGRLNEGNTPLPNNKNKHERAKRADLGSYSGNR